MMEKLKIESFGEISKRVKAREAELAKEIIIDENNRVIEFTKEGGYWIPLESLKNHEGVLKWMRHLLGKTWFTNEYARYFLDKIEERNKVLLHPLPSNSESSAR